MFGFNKVTVNVEALALIMQRRNFDVSRVEKALISIRGEYYNNHRVNRVLNIEIKKDKFFFKDAFGNMVTHIKQGVSEGELFGELKEIYNLL